MARAADDSRLDVLLRGVALGLGQRDEALPWRGLCSLSLLVLPKSRPPPEACVNLVWVQVSLP